MRFPFLSSIRTRLVLLVLISVLPSLVILTYSWIDRRHHEMAGMKEDALRVLHGLAYIHKHAEESTRQLLITIAKMPDVQNQNIATCNKLFSILHKENPLYATIFAANAEGMVFANALPFTPFSIKKRKYFQDILRKKGFAAGEYMIGVASGRRVLPFAYPVIDSNGRFKGVVVAGIDLDRYREMLDIARLPEGSSLALSDYKHIRLARYPGPEKYAGLPDLPDMVRHMSAEPEEGLFTSIGADSVKRLYAYKRFYLKGSMSPYLFMRVGIPEEKAYSPARQALLLGLILVWSSFIVAMLLAWFVGKAMIVQNIHRLVNATQQLGKGDLTARAGLDYEKGEMGQLAKAFDEMAEKLENSGEVLRLSEEKYRDIFENAVEGIFQTTKGGRFVSANPALAKLFKYDSPQEFMEQITDIARQHYVNPEDRQTYKSILERDGVIKGFETQLFSKDGNIVWASISARVVRNDVGAIICYEGTVEDITERKQAEAFIRDSEEKFSKAFKKSPLLMTISSIENGIYINVNDKFIEVSGFEREEAVGKTSVELGWIKPKDRELIIHDLKKKGSVDGIELELEAKDKRKVLCRFYGEAINIAGQQRLLSIAQDITFSKQAENLLRTSEEMFSKMFYSNPVLVAISTLEEGRFINVNNIFCDKLGYTPGEVIGKTSMELHFFPNPEQRAYIKQVLMATGRVRNIEVQVLAKDGSIINGLFSAEPLLIAGEACWITTMIDITKRKLAEEELLWKTAFLEAQVEATIDGILVVDSNNQKILINQNLLDIWKVPQHIRDDKDDTSLLRYVTSITKYPEEFLAKVVYLYDRPDEISRDEIEYKDGMILDRYSSPIRSKDGKYYGRIWTFRDITSRKQAEETLKSSLREKEVLLKEIQHRVKNNLLTISSVLALQLGRIKDDESRDAFITSMNRIRAMARIHTRLYQSDNYSLINFKGYIEELILELSRSYGFPPENMITDIEDISIDINTAIPTGLIVNELVNNVMKHAFPDGRKGQITITLSSEDSHIVLTVSDNGIGFPSSIDFRNTESVGLSLLVQLVEQINGSMELIRDNGTRFEIAFSIDQENTA